MTFFVQPVRAAKLNDFLAPGWTSYTVQWTSNGTAPSIGNGTLIGKYRRPAGSDLVHVQIYWAAGSTTAFGTGQYFFSLPFNAMANETRAMQCYLLDIGTANKDAMAFVTSGLDRLAIVQNTTDVSATAPHTWASGDAIYINGFYRPA